MLAFGFMVERRRNKKQFKQTSKDLETNRIGIEVLKSVIKSSRNGIKTKLRRRISQNSLSKTTSGGRFHVYRGRGYRRRGVHHQTTIAKINIKIVEFLNMPLMRNVLETGFLQPF